MCRKGKRDGKNGRTTRHTQKNMNGHFGHISLLQELISSANAGVIFSNRYCSSFVPTPWERTQKMPAHSYSSPHLDSTPLLALTAHTTRIRRTISLKRVNFLNMVSFAPRFILLAKSRVHLFCGGNIGCLFQSHRVTIFNDKIRNTWRGLSKPARSDIPTMPKVR